MLAAFSCLACRLQAEVHLTEQVADRSLADFVAFCLEFDSQTVCALAGPAQWRHGVPARRGLDQGVEVTEQAGIFVCQLFSPTSCRPNAWANMRFTCRRQSWRHTFKLREPGV